MPVRTGVNPPFFLRLTPFKNFMGTWCTESELEKWCPDYYIEGGHPEGRRLNPTGVGGTPTVIDKSSGMHIFEWHENTGAGISGLTIAFMIGILAIVIAICCCIWKCCTCCCNSCPRPPRRNNNNNNPALLDHELNRDHLAIPNANNRRPIAATHRASVTHGTEHETQSSNPLPRITHVSDDSDGSADYP